MYTPHVKDKVEDVTAVMQRQVRNSQTVQMIVRISRFSTSKSRRFQIEYVDEMRKSCAGSEEHRLAAKTALERHKQVTAEAGATYSITGKIDMGCGDRNKHRDMCLDRSCLEQIVS